MRFTINTVKLIVSLAINYHFAFLSFTATPISTSYISLAKNVEIAIEAITITIHADEGIVKVSYFRSKSKGSPTRWVEGNNVRICGGRNAGANIRGSRIKIIGSAISLNKSKPCCAGKCGANCPALGRDGTRNCS